MGVNDKDLRSDHALISGASCTTNCVTPLVYVLEKEGIGVEEALMSTSQSYTASQSIVDSPNKSDYREGRAAAQNMIPASTGAAKAVVQAMPSLTGKITGLAIRVPTVNVSLVDLTVRTTNPTSYQEIISKMEAASNTYLKNILSVTHDPVVSSDLCHDPRSSIVDALAGIELNSRFFKIIAWYDNEWGYSNRVAELLVRLSTLDKV
jgi:glyceraldehyde 3-phosphate dehydrogenase